MFSWLINTFRRREIRSVPLDKSRPYPSVSSNWFNFKSLQNLRQSSRLSLARNSPTKPLYRSRCVASWRRYKNRNCAMSPTDPVDLIFTGLRIKRPKPKIKEKLLELGLAQDRRELRKKRSRKSNQGEYTYSFFLPHHDPLWSIPCSGQSHPIPFASVFLTILRFRDYSHSISLLVTRLPATA